MQGAIAKFRVGQLVHHRQFDYRGVVFDVDPEFQGSEEWYQKIARSRPPRNKPWYHVLPDGGDHTTYVAERNLEPDVTGEGIQHPLVEELFEALEEDGYRPRHKVH